MLSCKQLWNLIHNPTSRILPYFLFWVANKSIPCTRYIANHDNTILPTRSSRREGNGANGDNGVRWIQLCLPCSTPAKVHIRIRLRHQFNTDLFDPWLFVDRRTSSCTNKAAQSTTSRPFHQRASGSRLIFYLQTIYNDSLYKYIHYVGR